MNKLIGFLNSIHPLPLPLKEYLRGALKETKIQKRKILIRPGQVCDRIYYIEKGLLRGSKILDNHEVNLWFMQEGDVMTSVISFYKGVNSAETIYALEDSHLFSITKKQLDHIYDTWIEFNIIARTLTEKYYVLDEEKLDMLRIQLAPDRYERFLQLYPGLEERITATHIASYLTITLETLSRIKKERRDNNSLAG